MVEAYLICLISSIIIMALFFVLNDKYSPTMLALVLVLVISNAGYYYLSVSDNLSEALLAMKIAYTGGMFMPVLMLFSVCDTCQVTLNKYIRSILLAFQFVLLGIMNTMGTRDWYYKSVEFANDGKVSHLLREYGPFHTVHQISLAVYLLAAVGISAYSLKKKNTVSSKNVKHMLGVFVVGIFAYFGGGLLDTGFETTAASDTLLFGFILLPMTRMLGHYYISQNISRVSEQSKNACYISFGRNVEYLGCNAIAKQNFPEVLSFEIDKQITNSEGYIFREVIPLINKFKEFKNAPEKVVKIDDKDWEIKIYEILKSNKLKIGYLAEISDVTERQRYVDMVEKYNHNLEEQVEKEKEQKQLIEEALEKAEVANRSKSAFLSKMSHEIRTPLNAVLGMDEMILRETDEDNTREYGESIRSAGQTLLSLINDILDLSKIESGKLEVIPVEYDLNSVINDLANIIRPKAKENLLEFKVEMEDSIPHLLYGDEIRIKQIIMNILSNAVKYTKEGSVVLKVNHDVIIPGREINLKVSVSDTGIGIKAEDISKLFSPYMRLDEKRNRFVEGTGLGMSITKQLLELMDSHLDVSSEYGKGSVFSFEIKQEVRDAAPVGQFAKKEQSSEKSKKYRQKFTAPEANIMVVDDVETNLIVIKHLLKSAMVNLDLARSGMECLELAKTKKYDIIFLDHMMPEMDGFETLEALKQQKGINEETPVIALTANVIVGARDEYIDAGFKDYLGKPIEAPKLEAMLLNYIPVNKIINNVGDSGTGIQENEIDFGNMSEDKKAIFEKIRQIKGIDVYEGIKASGTAEIYVQVTEDYFNTGGNRIGLISRYFETMDYKNYTIQVHALKSTSRLIGYTELSKLAESLEAAGNKESEEFIKENTPVLLKMYKEVLAELSSIFDDTFDKEEISADELADAMNAMSEALESFDIDTADLIVKELNKYGMPKKFKDTFKKIRVMLSEVDRDGLIEIINSSRSEWEV
ncbi:MAG: ATP-binding protein [Lachnospiraceae bacterium]|nr:ATP-binding protein [Lachnospiraceae bacterium]